MFEVVPYFRGSYDRYGYEYWESQLEDLFSYFELTTEQKFCYAQLRLDREAYYLWKANHMLCRSWFLFQSLLRARYAPHLYTVSEPKFEWERELESLQITNHFTEFQEFIDDIWKLVTSQTAINDMFRAYSSCRAWRSWWVRARSCCWVGAIASNSFSVHKYRGVSY